MRVTKIGTGHRLERLGVGILTLLLSGATIADDENHWREPGSSMEFVRIPAGCFQMGASQAKPMTLGGQPMGPRVDELPRHRVCLDEFWLGTHEVTRAQWPLVMGGEAVPADQASLPKAYVTWENAQGLIQRLNQASGNSKYRLPTEAEWEYACRAGADDSLTEFNSPEHLEYLMTVVRISEPVRSDPTAFAVGKMPSNPWGLYDMLGNVWEWTSDEYVENGYSLHTESNPRTDQGGDRRVIRGASFNSDRFQVRCGSRNYGIPDDPLPTQGLRLVRQPAKN